jgi:YHS domain-containing protein/mono/diheme cytochrome c family protein
MLRTTKLLGIGLGLVAAMVAVAAAAERDQRTEVPAAADRAVSFSKDVGPLLAARCGNCHTNGKRSGGFRMDSRELFLAGGNSGPVVRQGQSGESRLIQLVAAFDPEDRMPPEGPILSNEHVGILRAWIDQGLEWETDAVATKPPGELTAAEAEAAGLCPVSKVPSKLVYHTTLGGRKFHFCCPECKQAFVADPARYGVAGAAAAGGDPAQPAPVAAVPLKAPALARLIDEHVQRRLDEKGISASPPADDAEFLRRLYLDLHGRIPPAAKVAAFLDNPDPGKRESLIEELLADPQYGRHMADVWDHLLVPRNTPGCEPAVAPLTAYLEQRFNDNVPWDELVRELITATGVQRENGAVTYFLANHTTTAAVDASSRIFLSVRLECAQCHDHPYTRWEQQDYWAFAGFFDGVNRSDIDRKTGILVIKPESSSVTEKATLLQISLPAAPGREQKKGRRAQIPARFPGAAPLAPVGDQPLLARPLAASWMTAPENPYFARAAVNRMWWHFFGRGLVDPVDDMFKPEANATHPELLEALAAQFAAGGFDLKHLARAIAGSQAYQRTSKPASGNQGDRQLYSRMTIKVLTPEQMWDSLVGLFGREPEMPPRNPGRILLILRNGVPTTPRGEFVSFFLGDSSSAPTEYAQGIPHALRLLNGLQFNNVDDVVGRITPPENDPARAVEALYLAALSRRPTAAEATFMTDYVKLQDDRQTAYADILWALLKSSEFVMNH